MSEQPPALGANPRVASVIAYSAWWATGALVWLIDRDRPAVRFHAMQSMVADGTYKRMMDKWGVGGGALSEISINLPANKRPPRT